MVQFLKHHLAFFLLMLASLAFVCQSCVTQTPIPQYADNITFSTLYTHDDIQAQSSDPVADSVAEFLNSVLVARNLHVEQISFDSVKPQLDAIRDTDRRIQALKASAPGSQFILLTEISTEFYSPLSGRYRWDVNVNITLYDMVGRQSMNDKFSLPATLMYSHEDGDDAIKSVQTELQRRIGSLVDRFMKGRAVDNRATPDSKREIHANPPAPAPQPDQYAPPAVDSEPASEEAPLAGGASPKAEAIYFILIDRFFNARSDNDFDIDLKDPAGWHGGDIEGVRQKLPYLQKLGITKIWLSPVFTAASQKFFGNAAFHGYWTYDLNSIDKHFGPESDLQKLAVEAKKYNIELVLDLVVNHVGYGSKWIQERPAWFHPSKTIEDWNDLKQLTEREVHGLPDLNQDNPEVYQYIMNASQKWLNLPNIAGYRLDAVKHVGLDFWTKFNTALLSQHPNMMLLGEYFDGDPKKVDEIQKKGRFTHLFDFPLAFALRDVYCENRSLAALASVVVNDRQYENPNHMVTFIDNHDMPRFISLCKNNTNDMALALKVLLAWRGVPNLYYGTEYPLAGEKEPENRADMNFNSPLYYSLIQNMLQVRSAYPVLATGKTAVIDYKKDFAVIGRELNQQQAVMILSRGNQPQNYTLPEGNWLDIESHVTVNGQIRVKPNSVQILVRKQADRPILKSGSRTVTFHVPNDGKTYAITGSSPELGQWNPQAAPKTTGNKPITLTLPPQTVIVYKPVQIDGNQINWANGDNRELFTENDKDITVIW